MMFIKQGEEPSPSRLPKGYTELEWIASSGTQHINTQVSALGTWNFDAQATAINNTSKILINKSANGGQWFGGLNNNKWGSAVTSGGYTSVDCTTKASIVVTYGSSTISGTVNNESFTRSRNTDNNNYYLFATSNGQYPISAKLWEITLKSGETLLFDGVPCRNSNNEVGLYDLVNERFLGNSGSGSLIGSDE